MDGPLACMMVGSRKRGMMLHSLAVPGPCGLTPPSTHVHSDSFSRLHPTPHRSHNSQTFRVRGHTHNKQSQY